MNTTKRVLIVAGGTGGHVFPGLAIAQALQAEQVQVEWLGTPMGIEAQVVPAANIPLTFIKIRGIRGMGWRRWLRAPLDLVRALCTTLGLLRRFKPHLVIAMGGFSAGPAGVACWLTRVPLVVHEQNSIAGFTNRVLTHVAQKTLLGLPQAVHPHGLQRGILTGNPVRTSLLTVPPPTLRFATRTGPLRLLVLGGSQGASALNTLLPQALGQIDNSQLVGECIEVWHQTGQRHLAATQQAYAEQAPQLALRLAPFIEDMAEAYAWADLVICRAGALTIAELAAVGVAALLIPFPAAIDDHQTQNALYLVNLQAARWVPQRGLTAAQLAKVIQKLGSDRAWLQTMAVAAHTAGFPQATTTIMQEIKGLL